MKTMVLVAIAVVGIGIVVILAWAAIAIWVRATFAGRTKSEAMARQRVAEVADALSRYKARTGAYRRDLHELVPDYLPEIPLAKAGSEIMYLYSPDDPMLLYRSFGFYRPILHVASGRWSAVD